MMMKNAIVLLTCTLLFSSLAVLALQGSLGPEKCCLQFISYRLRKDNVVSYKRTDVRCSMEGVYFKMKNRNVICADPSQSWVKKLMKDKDGN